MNSLIRMLEGIIGRQASVEHLPPNTADMQTNQADVRKARNLLGWQPQVPLKEGVRRLVEWYTTERGWAKDISLG